MKSKKFGVNVGSSSILMVFVILCLVSFATLSIVSANADYKLSNKVATRTKAYYVACNEAEKTIAGIDQSLHELYLNANSMEDYFRDAGEKSSFLVDINDLQSLEITLTILYPETPEDAYYEITGWQVITTGELIYDDSLDLLIQ